MRRVRRISDVFSGQAQHAAQAIEHALDRGLSGRSLDKVGSHSPSCISRSGQSLIGEIPPEPRKLHEVVSKHRQSDAKVYEQNHAEALAICEARLHVSKPGISHSELQEAIASRPSETSMSSSRLSQTHPLVSSSDKDASVYRAQDTVSALSNDRCGLQDRGTSLSMPTRRGLAHSSTSSTISSLSTTPSSLRGSQGGWWWTRGGPLTSHDRSSSARERSSNSILANSASAPVFRATEWVEVSQAEIHHLDPIGVVLPHWVFPNNGCSWKSSRCRQPLAVTIREVSHQNRQVLVSFDSDPGTWKAVPFAAFEDMSRCPLCESSPPLLRSDYSISSNADTDDHSDRASGRQVAQTGHGSNSHDSPNPQTQQTDELVQQLQKLIEKMSPISDSGNVLALADAKVADDISSSPVSEGWTDDERAVCATEVGVQPNEHALKRFLMDTIACSPLPPNWAARHDHEGQLYYWNALTEDTSWQHPHHAALCSVVVAGRELLALPCSASRIIRVCELQETTTEDFKSNVAQWAYFQTPEGQTYYHNGTTGETTWDNPEETLNAPMQVLVRALTMLGNEAYVQSLLSNSSCASVSSAIQAPPGVVAKDVAHKSVPPKVAPPNKSLPLRADEVKDVFRLADLGDDGLMTFDEISNVMQLVGDFSESELREMFLEVDVGSSGRVSFEKFVDWAVAIDESSIKEREC